MWPFGRTEKRSAGAGYTDAVVDALLHHAAGGTKADPSETAALEAAAGQYARAFALAQVVPANPATRPLTPAVLAAMARDLIRRGECLHLIEADRDGVRLLPVASWDVRGQADPSTWRYRVVMSGPSSTITRSVPGAAVVHGRYSTDPARPWCGISPLKWASLTGRLHAELESALADEAGGTRGHVLPIPQSPVGDEDEVDEDGNPVDPLAKLRRDVKTLRGKTALVETVAAAWGEGRGAAPAADWKPQRLGADPPPTLATLRTDSAVAILAASGLPPGLFDSSAAAGQRESWRRFLHGSVQPLGELLAVELADKLAVPGLTLGFDRLMASDLAGRSRAYQSLTGAGMDADRAAELAGLT